MTTSVEEDAPEVSVFLPTAKRLASGLLERAVDSALTQEGITFELLAVDDGSIDGTQQYLEELASRDSRVRVVRLERNTGLPAYALAQAYPLARGKYFAWLFDDCELHPGHLTTLRDALAEDPALGLVYAQVNAQIDTDHSYVIGSPVNPESFGQGANVIPNVCCMVPREVIARVGWYDPHIVLKRICDWDLWKRILESYPYRFIPQVLATEKGIGLPGSLGHTATLHMDLALKYSSTERNGRLAPTAIRLADAFYRDLWPLEEGEAKSLEIMFFEHATLIQDFDLALDIATHLAALAGDSETVAAERMFNASHALFRDRLRNNAMQLIEFETVARDALHAADDRAAMLSEMASQLNSMEHERSQLKARLEEVEAKSLTRDAADMQGAAEALKETQDLLYVFRDAADQRMDMLRLSNARVEELTMLAEERLAIIERLTHDLESLQTT